MNELLNKLPQGGGMDCAVQSMPCGPIDQLRMQKESLEGRLKQINAALEALEKNPEIANLLQLVGRALR